MRVAQLGDLIERGRKAGLFEQLARGGSERQFTRLALAGQGLPEGSAIGLTMQEQELIAVQPFANHRQRDGIQLAGKLERLRFPDRRRVEFGALLNDRK